MAADLVVRIIGDAKSAAAAADQTSSKFGKMGKVAAGIAATGVAAIGTALAATAISGVQDAANLEQSIGAIDAVFKGSAGQMHTWSKSAATDVGLTRNEFNELGTLIGAQLKNGGTAMDQLAPKTKQLIGVGADLSSMFGGSTKEAVEALSSALKGERDPIEKYGVSLNQAKIDAEAASMGFKKVGGSFDQQAQQAATLSLIMKQTADAQGNFAREGDTLAHQQQVLAATWGDMKAQLGMALLPLINRAFTFINTTAVPAVKALFGAFKGDGGGIGAAVSRMGFDKLWTALKSVGAAIGTVVMTYWPQLRAAFQAIAPQVLGAQSAVIGLVTALLTRLGPVIQWLAPLVVTAFGVIARIVGAAMGLVSSIIRTVTAVIRGDWKGAWDGVKSILSNAWKLIVTIVTGGIKLAIAQVKTFGPLAVGVLKGAWNLVVAGARAAWSLFKSAVSSGISTTLGVVRGFPGRIVSALGNLGGLLRNAGRVIIDGFLGGLKAKFQDVKSFVGLSLIHI